LKRASKHRKMFPGFYRGELMAPSAHSIACHNQLIRKLLGKEQAKSVVQNRQHDGTGIQKTLFSSSDSSGDEKRSQSSESSTSEDDDDDEFSKNKWSSDRKNNNPSHLLRLASQEYDDAETSSDDDDSGGDTFDSTKSGNHRSTFGLEGEKKSGILRRRSVVARGLAGFGKALIGM